jgi:hypothetical protein
MARKPLTTAELVAVADQDAVDAANRLSMTYLEMFDWANSKVGRWYGDCAFGGNGLHTAKYLPGAEG